MTATVAGIHLGLDTHANRPAGNAVPDGSVYSCSTHALVYKSNFAGNSWATWATLGGVALSSATPLVESGSGGAGAGTAASKDDHVHPAAGGASPLLAAHACVVGDYGALTSTSMADVDATNMAVTFTAPASGNVLVRLSAPCAIVGTLLDIFSWGLRESTTNIAGAASSSIAIRNPGNSMFVAASMVFVLTGISAGSHTYKWAYSVSAGTGNIRADANAPAVMEVWAV